MAVARTITARRWPLIVLALAALAGLANLAMRLRGDLPHADFREIWIAGHVWRAGGHTYGADYHAFGLASFGPSYPHMWPYPPHIWALAIPFSLPDPQTALILWNALGLLLTIGAGALLGLTFGRSGAERLGLGLGIIAYVGLMTASGSAYLVGQTGYLVLFGLALLAFGIARGCTIASVAAMALLMLKPQVGLIACAAVLPTRGGIRAVAWAVALVVVASLPALAIEGVRPTIDGYLANLALYRTIPYDLPIAMTGIGHLVAWAGGPDLSAIGMSLAGALVALALLVGQPEEAASRWLLATIGAMAGFAFLHIYDLVLAAPAIALLPRLAGAIRALVILGLALIVRPENLAHLLHLGSPAAVTIVSLGCIALLGAGIVQRLARPFPVRA